jgi:hypothetical protein
MKIYNDVDDITDKLNVDETTNIFIIKYKCPTELEYEKIRVKFNNALIKYLINMKTDPEYYESIYKTFFNLWKNTAINTNNPSLFDLLKYLTMKNAYNIKKTIFSTISHENLKNKIYHKFITDFIELSSCQNDKI